MTAILASGPAAAPQANGETPNIQNYAGITGNTLHAIIAKAKGFCEKRAP
jgi:hypothetical protein